MIRAIITYLGSSMTMDVGDGTSGTSADVPGRRSWTGVGLILMCKSIEKKEIDSKSWKKIIYFC